MTYDQVAPYCNSLSFTLVICIVTAPSHSVSNDWLIKMLLALDCSAFASFQNPSNFLPKFPWYYLQSGEDKGDFSLRFHERSIWEYDSLLMTFSSGFSKTTQASGLKIKPGLRANWVIRKNKSHALGAVEGRFCKVGYRNQNNGHVCLPQKGVERWKVETCDYWLD